MVVPWFSPARCWRAFTGIGTLLAVAMPLQAQVIVGPGQPPCATPGIILNTPPLIPATPGTVQPFNALPGTPNTAPSSPTTSSATPSVSTQVPEAPEAAPAASSVALGGGGFSAPLPAVGYIDSAVPTTMFRLRLDAADHNNRPDRADFFYPKCGCFSLVPAAQGGDPRAAGLGPKSETRVDYQEFSSYFEYAASNRLSGFVEVPVRFLQPEQNADTAGLGDMNIGFKYALIANEDQFVTFQFRTYLPTGAASQGLGTDNVNLEPALLWHQPLGERLALDAELRDWIPLGGSPWSGNVLREGIGLSYAVVNSERFRVIPVGEIVAWEVLSGKELAVPAPNIGYVKSAAGEAIVNAKFGVRFGFGKEAPALLSRSDLYVGYGRALTGDVWYKDIARVEWRLRF